MRTLTMASHLSPRASVFLRTMSTVKSPGLDPLELLRKSSEKRKLCDANGIRKPDVHWTFGISTSRETLEAPSLRTIDFQRVTTSGIEFVRKQGKGASLLINPHKASSILCSFGKYRTGEKVEQWLAEGSCHNIPLEIYMDNDGVNVFQVVPARSIVELVASRIVKQEQGTSLEDDHTMMDKESHYMEIVQRTRNRLEAGELTREELDQAMMIVRFIPDRMERYIGGPDQVMWERWEWKRDLEGGHDDATAPWKQPIRLLPY